MPVRLRVLAAILLLVGLTSFRAAGADTDDKLHIVTENGRYTFTVEIADTPDKRSQGLMFRESMAQDAGMLFIARDGRIADMHRNAQPHSLRSIRSKMPVFAVLEINAGLTSRLGIRVGDRVEHPAFEPGD